MKHSSADNSIPTLKDLEKEIIDAKYKFAETQQTTLIIQASSQINRYLLNFDVKKRLKKQIKCWMERRENAYENLYKSLQSDGLDEKILSKICNPIKNDLVAAHRKVFVYLDERLKRKQSFTFKQISECVVDAISDINLKEFNEDDEREADKRYMNDRIVNDILLKALTNIQSKIKQFTDVGEDGNKLKILTPVLESSIKAAIDLIKFYQKSKRTEEEIRSDIYDIQKSTLEKLNLFQRKLDLLSYCIQPINLLVHEKIKNYSKKERNFAINRLKTASLALNRNKNDFNISKEEKLEKEKTKNKYGLLDSLTKEIDNLTITVLDIVQESESWLNSFENALHLINNIADQEDYLYPRTKLKKMIDDFIDRIDECKKIIQESIENYTLLETHSKKTYTIEKRPFGEKELVDHEDPNQNSKSQLNIKMKFDEISQIISDFEKEEQSLKKYIRARLCTEYNTKNRNNGGNENKNHADQISKKEPFFLNVDIEDLIDYICEKILDKYRIRSLEELKTENELKKKFDQIISKAIEFLYKYKESFVLRPRLELFGFQNFQNQIIKNNRILEKIKDEIGKMLTNDSNLPDSEFQPNDQHKKKMNNDLFDNYIEKKSACESIKDLIKEINEVPIHGNVKKSINEKPRKEYDYNNQQLIKNIEYLGELNKHKNKLIKVSNDFNQLENKRLLPDSKNKKNQDQPVPIVIEEEEKPIINATIHEEEKPIELVSSDELLYKGIENKYHKVLRAFEKIYKKDKETNIFPFPKNIQQTLNKIEAELKELEEELGKRLFPNKNFKKRVNSIIKLHNPSVDEEKFHKQEELIDLVDEEKIPKPEKLIDLAEYLLKKMKRPTKEEIKELNSCLEKIANEFSTQLNYEQHVPVLKNFSEAELEKVSCFLEKCKKIWKKFYTPGLLLIEKWKIFIHDKRNKIQECHQLIRSVKKYGDLNSQVETATIEKENQKHAKNRHEAYQDLKLIKPLLLELQGLLKAHYDIKQEKNLFNEIITKTVFKEIRQEFEDYLLPNSEEFADIPNLLTHQRPLQEKDSRYAEKVIACSVVLQLYWDAYATQDDSYVQQLFLPNEYHDLCGIFNKLYEDFRAASHVNEDSDQSTDLQEPWIKRLKTLLLATGIHFHVSSNNTIEKSVNLFKNTLLNGKVLNIDGDDTFLRWQYDQLHSLMQELENKFDQNRCEKIKSSIFNTVQGLKSEKTSIKNRKSQKFYYPDLLNTFFQKEAIVGLLRSHKALQAIEDIQILLADPIVLFNKNKYLECLENLENYLLKDSSQALDKRLYKFKNDRTIDDELYDCVEKLSEWFQELDTKQVICWKTTVSELKENIFYKIKEESNEEKISTRLRMYEKIDEICCQKKMYEKNDFKQLITTVHQIYIEPGDCTEILDKLLNKLLGNSDADIKEDIEEYCNNVSLDPLQNKNISRFSEKLQEINHILDIIFTQPEKNQTKHNQNLLQQNDEEKYAEDLPINKCKTYILEGLKDPKIIAALKKEEEDQQNEQFNRDFCEFQRQIEDITRLLCCDDSSENIVDKPENSKFNREKQKPVEGNNSASFIKRSISRFNFVAGKRAFIRRKDEVAVGLLGLVEFSMFSIMVVKLSEMSYVNPELGANHVSMGAVAQHKHFKVTLVIMIILIVMSILTACSYKAAKRYQRGYPIAIFALTYCMIMLVAGVILEQFLPNYVFQGISLGRIFLVACLLIGLAAQIASIACRQPDDLRLSVVQQNENFLEEKVNDQENPVVQVST